MRAFTLHVLRVAFVLLLTLASTSCKPPDIDQIYDSIAVGTLHGNITVRWLKPDQFLFLPDPDNPLTFRRSNGDSIVPGKMLTDGGSIPRPLWILRNYSPWGYAPAFIAHDWLFYLKQCQLPGHDRYDVRDAARVLAEVMKTMMETNQVATDKPTTVSMYMAVSSPVARKLWDEGSCRPPPTSLANEELIQEFQLRFP